jgi:hypothetical protein
MKAPTCRDTVKAAADAVVEFALIAFEPEFLLWEKDVNLRLAELIWNSGGSDPFAMLPAESELALATLADRLARARRERWGEETFLVLGLDLHYENHDFIFTFDVTWDAGETFRACEMAVD